MFQLLLQFSYGISDFLWLLAIQHILLISQFRIILFSVGVWLLSGRNTFIMISVG